MRIRPLWKGPYKSGVSQSMLCDFMVCKHRFYIKYILGLYEDEGFRKELEYGNMWHEAEKELANGRSRIVALSVMKKYEVRLKKKYPADIEEITTWSRYCRDQFTVYCDYYKDDPSPGETVVAEKPFVVPYELPSGRTVNLRGMIDRLYKIPSPRKGAYPILILQDNKCKGKVDERRMGETLFHNIQLCIYGIAAQLSIEECEGDWCVFNMQPDLLEGTPICPAKKKPLRISRLQYNLIKRPLSEKYPIRQKKAESNDQFAVRIKTQIKDNPGDYFSRPQLPVTQSGFQKFERETLVPKLEELYDWWEWISENPNEPFREGNRIHSKTPWGVYNAIYNEYKGDYYEYLVHGRDYDLEETKLFPELEL